MHIDFNVKCDLQEGIWLHKMSPIPSKNIIYVHTQRPAYLIAEGIAKIPVPTFPLIKCIMLDPLLKIQ